MEESVEDIVRVKRKLYKNIAILIVMEFLFFVAQGPTDHLQSSFNIEKSVGTISSSVGLCSAIVFFVLFSGLWINLVGHKYSIIIGNLARLLYVVANLYVTWYTLIPAAIVYNVLGQAGQLSIKATLIIYAEKYCGLTGASLPFIIGCFLGLDNALRSVGAMIGDVITYEILNVGYLEMDEANITNRQCGVFFVESDYASNQHFDQPRQFYSNLLFGVLSSACVIGTGICLCLDSNPDSISYPKTGVILKGLSLFKNWKIFTLFIMSINFGFVDAFNDVEVSKSFTTCLIGMQFVGLIPILSDFMQVTGSLVLSRALDNYRVHLFTSGIALETAGLLLALFWTPNLKNDYLIICFIVSALSYIKVIVNLQPKALAAMIFPEKKDPIYSISYVGHNLGQAIINATSAKLQLDSKIYYVICGMIIMTIFYITLEYTITKDSKKILHIKQNGNQSNQTPSVPASVINLITV